MHSETFLKAKNSWIPSNLNSTQQNLIPYHSHWGEFKYSPVGVEQ